LITFFSHTGRRLNIRHYVHKTRLIFFHSHIKLCLTICLSCCYWMGSIQVFDSCQMIFYCYIYVLVHFLHDSVMQRDVNSNVLTLYCHHPSWSSGGKVRVWLQRIRIVLHFRSDSTFRRRGSSMDMIVPAQFFGVNTYYLLIIEINIEYFYALKPSPSSFF
jgi:hypothetical protein